MMRGVWLGATLALLLLSLVMPASAASEAAVNAQIDAMLGHSALYETSIKLFQQAVANGDGEDVAAFVRYPIVVTIGSHRRVILSARAFLQHYDAIMTPAIVAAVAGQSYADLAVSRRGVRFADGEVRIDGICLDRHCRRIVPKVVSIRPGRAN
jgi:hypothetical protein